MSPLNQETIIRKTKLISDDLQRLKKYENVSFEDFEANYDSQLIVERLLEKILGRAIDINYHILKEEYQQLPKDYFESFLILGKVGHINLELAESMAPAAGARNVLAHEYDQIDLQKVYESIQLALTTLPKYLLEIQKKMETE